MKPEYLYIKSSSERVFLPRRYFGEDYATSIIVLNVIKSRTSKPYTLKKMVFPYYDLYVYDMGSSDSVLPLHGQRYCKVMISEGAIKSISKDDFEDVIEPMVNVSHWLGSVEIAIVNRQGDLTNINENYFKKVGTTATRGYSDKMGIPF